MLEKVKAHGQRLLSRGHQAQKHAQGTTRGVAKKLGFVLVAKRSLVEDHEVCRHDDETNSTATRSAESAGSRLKRKLLTRRRRREHIGMSSSAHTRSSPLWGQLEEKDRAEKSSTEPNTSLSAPEITSLNDKAQRFFGVQVSSNNDPTKKKLVVKVCESNDARPRPQPAVGSTLYETHFDQVFHKRSLQFSIAFPTIQIETTMEEFYLQALRCQVPYAQLDNFVRMRILEERKVFYFSDLS